jgi:hypothetical protein
MQAVATIFHGHRSPPPAQCFGVLDRLWARLRARRLDQALARGVPAEDSPALSWRAQVLARPSVTHELGTELRRLVSEAHDPGRALLRVQADPERLISVEAELRRLASRLDSARPSHPAGVAKVRLLLTDGTGPLYGCSSVQALDAAVQDAFVALA